MSDQPPVYKDGGVRRETQEWPAWDDESLTDWYDRIEAVLRKNPNGLTDEEIQAIIVIKPHETISGCRRNLVKFGRVRYAGFSRKSKRTGRMHRVWIVGRDTPEQIAGVRRWPPVYTEIREGIKGGS